MGLDIMDSDTIAARERRRTKLDAEADTKQMPEEGTSGILVHPMGSPVEQLTHDEHETLSACLGIFREGNTSASCDALSAIVEIAAKLGSYPDPKEDVLKAQIADFLYNRENEGEENHRGVLAGKFKDRRLVVLDEGELAILDDTVTAIRQGGWFKPWLEMQVTSIAKASHPEDRFPSPQRIAGSLVIAITEWNDEADTMKRLATERPDLIAKALVDGHIRLPPAAPAAGPEPIATSTKPKPRRARRKAA
jgi:hypothetical protein